MVLGGKDIVRQAWGSYGRLLADRINKYGPLKSIQVIDPNVVANGFSASSAQYLMACSGWSDGTRFSGEK